MQQYLRIKQIASTPARPARKHIYKTGANAGQARIIKAKPASSGLLPVTEKTIWQWTRQGKFPQPIKLSEGVTVWRLVDVMQWIESNHHRYAA